MAHHKLNEFYSDPQKFRQSMFQKKNPSAPVIHPKMKELDKYIRHMSLAGDYLANAEAPNIAMAIYHYWKAMKIFPTHMERSTQALQEFQTIILQYPRKVIIREIGKLLESPPVISHENATDLLTELLNSNSFAGGAFWSKGEPDKELASLMIHTIPSYQQKISHMIRAVGWDTNRTLEENRSDPLFILFHKQRLFFGHKVLFTMETDLGTALDTLDTDYRAAHLDRLDLSIPFS